MLSREAREVRVVGGFGRDTENPVPVALMWELPLCLRGSVRLPGNYLICEYPNRWLSATHQEIALNLSFSPGTWLQPTHENKGPCLLPPSKYSFCLPVSLQLAKTILDHKRKENRKLLLSRTIVTLREGS